MLSATPSVLALALSALCLWSAVQPSEAGVDTSSPDLSVFNLQRIASKELAKQRVGRPIDDLATGAIHMRESLFVTASNIRCPAYAHLFKLIKRQQSSPPSDLSVSIRQNVVASLAVVVTYDRIVYYKMFLESVKLGETADHFAEAVEALESTKDPHARDAWLDLIECVSEYMLGPDGNLRAIKLMEDPRRAQAVEAVKNFKAIAPVDSDRPPAGITSGLKNKFEAMAKGGRDYVSASHYEPARDLINRIEGSDIAQMKQRIMAQPLNEPEEHPEPSGPAEPIPPKVDVEEIASVDLPNEVNLVVPHGDTQTGGEESQPACEAKAISCPNGISADQLAILQFIKMRLEMKPARRYEKVPRLSVQLALDFQSHWQDLEHAYLNADTPLGAEALRFRQDPTNVKLAEFVNTAISEYVSIVSRIAEINMQSDRMKDLDGLRESVKKLGEHLSKIEGSFDVDDLRRVHELWKSKLVQYNALDKFICAESW